MAYDPTKFTHDFDPGEIHYGRGCITKLDALLTKYNLHNAIVVCGKNVGADNNVIEPIKKTLGKDINTIFDKTTPSKRIETVYRGVEIVKNSNIDVVIAVGGGSSLDVATLISMLSRDGRGLNDIINEANKIGTVETPDNTEKIVPRITIPTTFAGADLSKSAGIRIPVGNEMKEIIISSELLFPKANIYDPNLFGSTPINALLGSAMNGFDKGIESMYYGYENPISLATATESLKLLCSALPNLAISTDNGDMGDIVLGMLLAGYSMAIPGEKGGAPIHAFGHGLKNHFDIQQGIAHAIIAPHVLEWVLQHIDVNRDRLAEALGAGSDSEEISKDIVAAVSQVRDSLNLPTKLRGIEAASKEYIGPAAKQIFRDELMDFSPLLIEPSIADIEKILLKAW